MTRHEPRLRVQRPPMAYRMTQMPDDPYEDVKAVAMAIVLLVAITLLGSAMPREPRQPIEAPVASAVSR